MRSITVIVVLLVCVCAIYGGPVERRSPVLKAFKCCLTGSSGASSPKNKQKGKQTPVNNSPHVGPMSKYASPAGLLTPGRTPPKSPSRLFGASPKILGGTGSMTFPTTKQRKPGTPGRSGGK